MPRHTLSPRAYAAISGGALLAGLALVWAWVAGAPLAFLDREYPSFLAKRQMLHGCDLGNVVVIGDSRAAADIKPALMPEPTTNLAIGGGGPVEAYYLLERALRCPQPPHRVVLSLNAGHFAQWDTLWDRSIRFGLLDDDEVADLRRTAASLGDETLDEKPDGLTGGLRALLYSVRFPSLYFGSFLKGGWFLRYWDNQNTLAEGLRARGHYVFGTAPGSSEVAMEGRMVDFTPAPTLDLYLDRLLTLAAQRQVRVDFVAMPVNEATARHVTPALRARFAAYLAGYERRFAGFHIVSDLMPAWPDRYFGDGFSHLNPDGATVLSTRLAACLSAAETGSPCVLQW